MIKYILSLFALILSCSTFAINAPTLVSPSNGAINQPVTIILDWSSVSGNLGYIYEIDTVPTFDSPLYFTGASGTNSSEISVYDLLFGKTYYWRAATKDVSDTSLWTSTRNFTILDFVTLTSPVNGAINQPSSVLLDWSAVTGNSGYLYEYDTVITFDSPLLISGASATNSSEFTANNLLFGTTYYWRAAVKNNVDTSLWTSARNFTTLDFVTLTSPVNGAINQPSSVLLDWSAVTGNSGYLYEYDTVITFDSPLLVSGASTTNSSEFTANNLLFGTTYYWRAAVKNNVDTSLWTSARNFTTTDFVTLVSPANGAINQAVSLTLDWSIVDGNSGYLYQYDIVPTFNSGSLVSGNSSVNSSQIAISGLLNGTEYFWRAAVKNNVDTSMWSSTRSFTTSYLLANGPILISPVAGTIDIPQNGQSFEWSSVAGASTYEIQYSTDAAFAVNVNSTISTTINVILNGLNYNSTYFWRVRAQDASGNSPWSTIWSFNTENCSVANTISESGCESFDFNGDILLTSGTYQNTLVGAGGCDSIVTLNLVIYTVNVLTSTTEPTITAAAAGVGVSYRWLDCDNSFAVISGETNQSFTAMQNGNYAVEVTENGCVDTSACASITTIGLDENDAFSNVSISPNPTKGIVNVEFGKQLSGSIKVFSATGQVVYLSDFEDATILEFNLNVKPGMYFVELSTTKNTSVSRVVVD